MSNLHNWKSLKEKRKALRNNLTPAEAKLWQLLKGKQCAGRKFRRQHSIGPYIVDFFCYAEDLIIEVDGSIHDDSIQKLNDSQRDQYLRKHGYQILRVKNEDVLQNPKRVLKAIKDHFR
jgi:very-short-patch-repair endonuclease